MEILTPDITTIKEIQPKTKTMQFFDNEVVEFLDELSKTLLKTKQIRELPELVAVGFWLRKTNIMRLKKRFFQKNSGVLLLPRGVVFHIAPTNVDTLFLYSLVLALLSGNTNILRISSKTTQQTQLLLDIFIQLLKRYKVVHRHIYLVRYAHDDAITSELSMLCDVRVLWGGDATIQHIRSIPIPPTAIELNFADKFSFAVFRLRQDVVDELFLEKFYRDSFTFLQNACSSVRSVCWIDTPKELQEDFWKKFVHYVAKKQPELEAKHTSDKLLSQTVLAIENKVQIKNSGVVSRVLFNSIEELTKQHHCGYGLFYELELDSLEEFFSHCDKKVQSVVLEGFLKTELEEVLQTVRPQGVDRVVKLGQASEFSATWDGFDILSSLCRIVNVAV